MITTEKIPDFVFDSNNNMEVPTLRLDQQPEGVEAPFVSFGEQRRTYRMEGHGVLHFYTDDYRFKKIFEQPEQISEEHNPYAIIEPNYSCFFETPIAFGLQYIYKKRYIARAMQEKGIKVFVDLNVSPKYYALNMLGVPKGYRAFATKGYPYRIYNLDKEYEIASECCGSENDLIFVVYGGGEEVKAWCANHQAVYITPMARFKEKGKLREQLENSIAFNGVAIEPKTLTLQSEHPQILHFKNQ